MMTIKVLGTGCDNCRQLKALAVEVTSELGMEAEVVEVTDVEAIMAYGVTQTPGLVIDEDLVGYGGVPTKAQLTTLVTTAAIKN